MEKNCELAGLTFDSATGLLTGSSGISKLEPRAADVLTLLFRERGALVTRQRLLDECWGEGSGSDEALTQTIAQIRRSLEALGAPRDVLTTYPKRGYRLVPDSAARAQDKRNRRMPIWAPLGLALALCILVLAIAPGWPRHAIRHALGLGPPNMHYRHSSPAQ